MHARRKVSCHCYLSASIYLFVSQAENAKTVEEQAEEEWRKNKWKTVEECKDSERSENASFLSQAENASGEQAEIVLSKRPHVIWVETETEPFLLPSSSPPFPLFCIVLKKKR